jgi:hypothetical protein
MACRINAPGSTYDDGGQLFDDAWVAKLLGPFDLSS